LRERSCKLTGILSSFALLLVFFILFGPFPTVRTQGAFSFFWFYFPCAVLVGCPLCVLLTGAACELGGCIVDPDEEHEKVCPSVDLDLFLQRRAFCSVS